MSNRRSCAGQYGRRRLSGILLADTMEFAEKRASSRPSTMWASTASASAQSEARAALRGRGATPRSRGWAAYRLAMNPSAGLGNFLDAAPDQGLAACAARALGCAPLGPRRQPPGWPSNRCVGPAARALRPCAEGRPGPRARRRTARAARTLAPLGDADNFSPLGGRRRIQRRYRHHHRRHAPHGRLPLRRDPQKARRLEPRPGDRLAGASRSGAMEREFPETAHRAGQ